MKTHTFPLGQKWTLLAVSFCGVVSKCQSVIPFRCNKPAAIGIEISEVSASSPPASKSKTETEGSSESLFASTAPDEPAPTII